MKTIFEGFSSQIEARCHEAPEKGSNACQGDLCGLREDRRFERSKHELVFQRSRTPGSSTGSIMQEAFAFCFLILKLIDLHKRAHTEHVLRSGMGSS